MNIIKKTSRLFFGLLIFCAAAQAFSFDGNTLHRILNGESKSLGAAYIRGVLDANNIYILASNIDKRFSPYFCPPKEYEVQQAIDIVKNKLANAPEDRHWDSDLLVMIALKDAWPCQIK